MSRNSLLLIPLIIVFSACHGPNDKKAGKQSGIPEYSIGVNLPLTGNGSYFAEEFKKGMDLVLNHYNDSSKKIKLNVIYEDNKFSPRDAITITKKFIEMDKVDMVLVGYTPLIQATANALDQADMLSLFTLCSAEDIAAPYEWAFRDFATESANMNLMADYMANILSFKKGSWLVVNDDMGADAAKFFTEAFEYNGGEIVSGEVFEASEMDLRNKISKIRDGDPDFILIVGRGSAMINACRQVREQNPDMPIIGGNTMDNDLVWNALGDQTNNIYFPSPFVDTEAQLYEKVSLRFFKSYGHEMNWCNTYGFTTANYLVKAFRKTAGDKLSLRDYLENLDEISLRGKLQMSDNRDVLVHLVVRSRVEGKSLIVYDGHRQSKEQKTN